MGRVTAGTDGCRRGLGRDGVGRGSLRYSSGSVPELVSRSSRSGSLRLTGQVTLSRFVQGKRFMDGHGL